MKSMKWLASYMVVASLGLGVAFLVSIRFMAPAHSQGAPSNGDLPPEFAKDINGGANNAGQATPPPPPAAANPNAAASPAASAAAPQQMPPPPPSNEPPPMPSNSPKTPGLNEKVAPSMPLPPAPGPQADASKPGPQDATVDNGATAGGPPIPTYVVPKDGYAYDPTGKRDPFKPFRAAVGDIKKVVLEPLQKWDLDRLKVVGILWDVRNPRAMVKDPEGAVYIVTKNSKIGRNEGYVAAVREGEVVVIETKYTETGAIKETYVMEFRK